MTFAASTVFSTGRGFFKRIKSAGLLSTGSATDLLCVFLYENRTDSTGRPQGAQSVAFRRPQPCRASWPAPIPLLLPIPQRTEGSHVVKVGADSAAIPSCCLYPSGCWSPVPQGVTFIAHLPAGRVGSAAARLEPTLCHDSHGTAGAEQALTFLHMAWASVSGRIGLTQAAASGQGHPELGRIPSPGGEKGMGGQCDAGWAPGRGSPLALGRAWWSLLSQARWLTRKSSPEVPDCLQGSEMPCLVRAAHAGEAGGRAGG